MKGTIKPRDILLKYLSQVSVLSHLFPLGKLITIYFNTATISISGVATTSPYKRPIYWDQLGLLDCKLLTYDYSAT